MPESGTDSQQVRDTDNPEGGEITTSFSLRKKKTRGGSFRKRDHVTV
jgi:hypothetical protein